ncbi:hypothetical protein [Nonomuraea sp. NPDC050202]
MGEVRLRPNRDLIEYLFVPTGRVATMQDPPSVRLPSHPAKAGLLLQ